MRTKLLNFGCLFQYRLYKQNLEKYLKLIDQKLKEDLSQYIEDIRQIRSGPKSLTFLVFLESKNAVVEF